MASRASGRGWKVPWGEEGFFGEGAPGKCAENLSLYSKKGPIWLEPTKIPGRRQILERSSDSKFDETKPKNY